MPEPQPQRLSPARLSCRDFLEGHSDYLDDLLAPEHARWFDQHVSTCRSCERYDRVVRQGLLLARNLPDVQPSPHFHEKLQSRLMGLANEPVHRPVVASSATVAVVAAVLAMIALTPLLRLAGSPDSAESASPVQQVTTRTVQPMVPRAAAVIVDADETSSFTPVVVQAPVWQNQPSAPRLVAYPMVQSSTR